MHREAVGLWELAFSHDPALGEDRAQRLLVTAARDACLAGAWTEAGGDPADAAARARLRRKGLEWLRAELGILRRHVKSGVGDARRFLRTLTKWRSYRDLASIRSEAAVGRLPATEREAVRSFWGVVEDLRQRAAKAAGQGTRR